MFLKERGSELDNFSVGKEVVEEWLHCPEGIRSTEVQEHYTNNHFFSLTQIGPDVGTPSGFSAISLKFLAINCKKFTLKMSITKSVMGTKFIDIYHKL
jgi:hypothetical protein